MPKHFVGRFLLSECDESTIAKPVNATQTEFNKISELGGGPKGGPARTKVCELLRRRGQALNEFADEQMAAHLTAYPNANPWHVCFSVGLCWGHLAKLDVDFTGAVVNVLADWNSGDLAAAKSFHMERGTEPIEQSLVGAHQLYFRAPCQIRLSVLGKLKSDGWELFLGLNAPATSEVGTQRQCLWLLYSPSEHWRKLKSTYHQYFLPEARFLQAYSCCTASEL
jgi:hypothetical protein